MTCACRVHRRRISLIRDVHSPERAHRDCPEQMQLVSGSCADSIRTKLADTANRMRETYAGCDEVSKLSTRNVGQNEFGRSKRDVAKLRIQKGGTKRGNSLQSPCNTRAPASIMNYLPNYEGKKSGSGTKSWSDRDPHPPMSVEAELLRQ